ncbi:MAG: B12-binding domain-containing radical SAM protein [Candidatus Hodarchaeales archaeon]
MVKISLHSFPPSLSCTPHPAIGYLKGFLESQNPQLDVQSFYWNQKIFTECFKEIKWLKESTIDTENAATIFRSLFGYLLVRDIEYDTKKEGLKNLRTFGSLLCPSFSKEEFLELANRLDKYLESQINQNNLLTFDIMGGSINLGQEIPYLMFLHRIKLENPSILTILGGLTAKEGKLLLEMFSFIDICVFGEGDETLLEICNSYPSGLKLEAIEGIVWRDNRGKIITNKERLPLANINNHWASYEGYQWEYDTVKMIGIWDSQSCHWGKCTFCHRTSKRNQFRERIVDDILAEINHHLANLKIQPDNSFLIRFLGSDVRGSSNSRFIALLEGLVQLKENFRRMTVFMELNPRYMTREIARLLDILDDKIQFGFEQWNARILREMKKPHTIESAIYTLKLIEDFSSIQIVGFNLLCGYPGETHEDIYQSFRTLLKLKFIMAQLYDKTRKYPVHIIPNPVSINPNIPIGKDWPWNNKIVERMIYTSPLGLIMSNLTNNLHAVQEFVKLHSYMTITNLENTEFLQMNLLKTYERMLASSTLNLFISSQGEVTLSMTSNNQTHKIILSNIHRRILEKTEKPISMRDICKDLSDVPRSAIEEILSIFESLDLIYSDRNRHINTLPIYIQDQINNIGNIGQN